MVFRTTLKTAKKILVFFALAEQLFQILKNVSLNWSLFASLLNPDGWYFFLDSIVKALKSQWLQQKKNIWEKQSEFYSIFSRFQFIIEISL